MFDPCVGRGYVTTWMWSGQAYLAIFLVTESLSCWMMSDLLDSTLSFSTTKANTAEGGRRSRVELKED